MSKEFQKKTDLKTTLKENLESEKKESKKTGAEQVQNVQTETEQPETRHVKAGQTETGQPEAEQPDQAYTQDFLVQKIADLEAQKAELEDVMLRQRAELENFRKRLVREKEDAIAFANTALIKELLQFLDNLERTIEAAKKSSDVKVLSDGVQMTRDQLLSTLEKNWGLEKIDPKGGEFLPAEHEACIAQTDPDIETETVLEVLQAGYKLHSRVLRPAKVKIAKPQ